MDYEALFGQAVDKLRAEKRYRIFTELARNCGSFPVADNYSGCDRRGWRKAPLRWNAGCCN